MNGMVCPLCHGAPERRLVRRIETAYHVICRYLHTCPRCRIPSWEYREVQDRSVEALS